MPAVHVDPFKLSLSSRAAFQDPARLFAMINELADDFPQAGKPRTRWQEAEHGWLVIDLLNEHEGSYPRWEGTIARVQVKDLGHIIGPKGSTPLHKRLEEDEGYSRHIAFLYDKRTELLWLQRDRRIVGQTAFGDYLRDVTSTSVSMKMVLADNALERANGLGVLRFASVGFYPKRGNASDLDEFLEQTEKFGDVRVDLKISAGRKQGLGEPVRKFVRAIGRAISKGDQSLVETAKVGGRLTEDDKKDMVIDLFNDRLDLTQHISDDRTREPMRLVSAVRQIWSRHRDDVGVEPEEP